MGWLTIPESRASRPALAALGLIAVTLWFASTMILATASGGRGTEAGGESQASSALSGSARATRLIPTRSSRSSSLAAARVSRSRRCRSGVAASWLGYIAARRASECACSCKAPLSWT